MNNAFGQPQSMVVLGATSDIARAIVSKLAPGCQAAVLAGRDETRLKEAADQAAAAGVSKVSTVVFDATDARDADEVVSQCFAEVGTVDLVLMAVGALGDQNVLEHDPVRSAELAITNYVWPSAALLAVADRLKRQGHGRIVVLSSVAGVRVRRANFVYGASKAGLDAFAIGLSEALRESGVLLHVVRPGFVRSRMTEGLPAAPLATDPDTVADAVVVGLARGDTVIWAPGVLRAVFAVLKNLPQSVWRRLPG